MALDWENIENWDAGEIALLTVIAFLLALLCAMIACILYYGKIYYTLKSNEGQPLYKSDGGDGPYNQTVRPHSYHEDSSDEEDDNMDEENNLNMSNQAMRQSFGHSALLKNRGHNMMRYSTNTTNQSASTESDSQTTGTSDEDETETDTQSKLKRNSYRHEDEDEDDDADDDEEDSDVINHRNRHHHMQHHAQLRGYNYIGTQHPMSYQGQYGNEIMQQHHNKIVSHQPPPPPGVIHPHSSHSVGHMQNVYNVTPSPHKTGHRASNTTMTSLTSITATDQRHASNKHRGSNYFSKDYEYSPSDKESRRV